MFETNPNLAKIPPNVIFLCFVLNGYSSGMMHFGFKIDIFGT